MFYDVMQSLARTVCEKNYNRERMSEKKLALKQLKLLKKQKQQEKMEDKVEGIFTKDYELEFDDVLSNMNRLDKNIDSVNQLKSIARSVGSKTVNAGAIDVNSDEDGDVYTSKHFVYGTLIVQCWREFIRVKELEHEQVNQEPDLKVSIAPMATRPGFRNEVSPAKPRTQVVNSTGASLAATGDMRGEIQSAKPETAAVDMEEADLEELGESNANAN